MADLSTFEQYYKLADMLIEKASKKDSRARSLVIRAIRDEVDKIGPGEPMPLFDRETKQRPRDE